MCAGHRGLLLIPYIGVPIAKPKIANWRRRGESYGNNTLSNTTKSRSKKKTGILHVYVYRARRTQEKEGAASFAPPAVDVDVVDGVFS